MENAIDTKKLENVDGFEISVSIYPEDISIEDALGFEATGADHSETIQKVIDGELMHFYAVVSAIKSDIVLGQASIGSNVYESLENFIEIEKKCYLHDLIADAVNDAKKTIQDINK